MVRSLLHSYLQQSTNTITRINIICISQHRPDLYSGHSDTYTELFFFNLPFTELSIEVLWLLCENFFSMVDRSFPSLGLAVVCDPSPLSPNLKQFFRYGWLQRNDQGFFRCRKSHMPRDYVLPRFPIPETQNVLKQKQKFSRWNFPFLSRSMIVFFINTSDINRNFNELLHVWGKEKEKDQAFAWTVSVSF